jgi:hypothetical protein
MDDVTLCLSCGLPDCYPTDSRCLVLRKKAEEKGLSLPEVPAEAPVREGARKYDDIVPETYTDEADYKRQYSKKYYARFGRIMIGAKLKKCDIEVLRLVCAKDDRVLEDEIRTLLELMAEKARSKGVV